MKLPQEESQPIIQLYVIINTTFEATHNWPKAPENTAFLRYPHRHVFHVCLKKAVSHADRDIEILALKKAINKSLQTYGNSLGHHSCEDIAMDLLLHHKADYVSVLEDGENGAEAVKRQ